MNLSKAASKNPHFVKKSLLIADQAENVRTALADMAYGLGFSEILFSANGSHARELLNNHKVDMVIAEYNLPKVDGCTLLQELRQDIKYSNTPFVMLSTTIEQHEVEKAIRLGVSEYLIKPFSRKLFFDKMRAAVKNPIKSNTQLCRSIKPKRPEHNKELAKPSVLIVDDIVENIQVIAESLKGPYNIQAVKSGVKAIQVCTSEQQPDIVLLDIKMPNMDGFEVCQRLKSNPLTKHITIIFITALGRTEDIVKGLKLGAVDYITKPINPEELKARVNTQARLVRANNDIKEQLDTVIENIRMRDEFDRILQSDLSSPLEEMLESIKLAEKFRTTPNRLNYPIKSIKKLHSLLSMHINNMISIHKIEDGSYQFSPQSVNLTSVISDVIASYELSIRKKSLEINFDDRHSVFIKAEHLLTTSIFSNLFRELVKETPSGLAITVSLNSNEYSTELQIKIPTELSSGKIEQYFRKYREYNSHSTLNIGNYAAKLMVELQQGTISLSSKKDVGTVITINFVTDNP